MRHIHAIGLLIVLNVIVFGQTATFDFVEFDDYTYFVNNPQFNGGLSTENVVWSFTTGYFVNWHPVTWLSLFLDNSLYGMNAGGYHVTNVIIHILATILLYLALFRMTDRRVESLIVAILFAIHPQHVQSVAWVSERKDVLSAFFMGLTLLAYHRYTLTLQWRWYGITAFVFAFGLMSKPMLVTLPCVLLLLDHWPLNRLADRASIRRAILEKVPLLAMAIASSVVTYIVQSEGGAATSVANLGYGGRVANASLAYGAYLLRTVWPVNLTFFYPLVISKIPYGLAAVSGVVLLVMSAAIWRWRKEAPAMLVGWLWYLGTLVPVIGLVQVGGQSSADRYTYIPLIGIFMGVVFTVHPWLQASEARRKVARYLYLAIVVSCLFISFKETYFWKDSVTLAGRGLTIRDDNRMAYQMLGNYYFGREEYERAEGFYKEYYAIDSSEPDIQLRLGTVLQQQGKTDEAEAMLLGCVERFPENATVRFNLGILMVAKGDMDAARAWYIEALSFPDPEPKFHINYGNLLAQEGDLDGALEQYGFALEIDPENVGAYHNRASSLFYHGKYAEALESVRACLAIDGDYEPALALLAAIESETGL